jgi:hypothetical protein
MKNPVLKVIQILRNADRVGSDKDEPEGMRWIQISDTLAYQMANELSDFIRCQACNEPMEERDMICNHCRK